MSQCDGLITVRHVYRRGVDRRRNRDVTRSAVRSRWRAQSHATRRHARPGGHARDAAAAGHTDTRAARGGAGLAGCTLSSVRRKVCLLRVLSHRNGARPPRTRSGEIGRRARASTLRAARARGSRNTNSPVRSRRLRSTRLSPLAIHTPITPQPRTTLCGVTIHSNMFNTYARRSRAECCASCRAHARQRSAR